MRIVCNLLQLIDEINLIQEYNLYQKFVLCQKLESSSIGAQICLPNMYILLNSVLPKSVLPKSILPKSGSTQVQFAAKWDPSNSVLPKYTY
jgi:hypothetical protein